MTTYRSFAADFPSRCKDLLDWFGAEARSRDREVTLMLAVASAGIGIPYERMRSRLLGREHVSQDRNEFDRAAAALDQELKEPVSKSVLLGGRWDQWEWFTPIPHADIKKSGLTVLLDRPYGHLPASMLTKEFLCHVRNALAHGSTAVRGGPTVERIFFLPKRSQNEQVYHLLSATPDAFHEFLSGWFGLLSSLPFPTAAQPLFPLTMLMELHEPAEFPLHADID